MRKAKAEAKAQKDAQNLSKKARGKNKPSKRTKRKTATIIDLRKAEWQESQRKLLLKKKKIAQEMERERNGERRSSALDRFGKK